jgi:hypothetical protein
VYAWTFFGDGEIDDLRYLVGKSEDLERTLM